MNKTLYCWKTKLLSGRLFLTLCAGICFFWLMRTLCQILVDKAIEIDVDKIILLMTNLALIIQNVFSSYFNKKRIEYKNEEEPK